MALEVAGTGSGAVMFEEEVAVFPEEISEAIAAAAPSEVAAACGLSEHMGMVFMGKGDDIQFLVAAMTIDDERNGICF
ncbi:hypothetical protein AVEN_205746-1 [Araneus ventricosus]|uniref:Uncharacterized protein n=1 Tax=Araneus ventricosus TaxID=182803 RepID=A0A4Y2UYZ5_ARAVE|nr:hypothetical protein AVEN_205746-1 [Araneus ventricosus]